MSGKARPVMERLPRLVNAAAGVWLIFMPWAFGYVGTAAATSDRIVGPFVVCFSVVAIWEATRGVRLANVPFGAWALIAPWVLGHPTAGAVGGVIAGLVILICSFLGGKVHQRFGGGWPVLWHRTPDDQLLTPPGHHEKTH